ncbi:dTDP-4-dehydrorhamnose reductase [Anoxybacillus flavithermus]|uniref:dTDP-4-dehydrorhamnose reductase n=1 Tax=Anoxybacillus flavithermus TaxID=33934 RepID=UPI0018662621|nr:dTDP-4-dehydrorhamnose reductase [Anoxybacillus flavithermus]MBE2940080.1 dTDP-4-dehydrorhamnose reductase [Anoxybacillus flavithermus]MBE2942833.1 dTDP-4-dehydrorhamnose reductase [Anoxybacillus flavithermus]MBE2951181.1 dTDP-4-dehydrorhamnose reductase [Anoxybacillus flavithermus]MBE2953821.1 dTDP-4-dehydrorhamnose reductase [Anoxybacillus flavithermus]MBE2959068.1 dTDP-4-dehydrorhamnose reductase [Anoxybacillus flavithermus]
MKIVVTGANGQLGQELVRQLQQTNFELYPFTKSDLDITNENIVNEVITKIKPDIIINAAAYTKVDQAEIEEETAYLVNAFGQRNLAVAAEKVGAKICYISTDYVFDGNSTVPYREYDQTNPLGVYGKSKLVGEELTKSLCSRYFIVRTAWVYGEFGQNFVKTMLKLAKEKEELGVVNDQIGSPTYTVDLARFVIELVQTEKFGIYHTTNDGFCSWYEFAKAVFEESNIDVKLYPITTEQFPRPAARPKYSVLDNFSMEVNGFVKLRHWREALREFLRNNV